jgi:ABC-type transport system involved in multi-copper enzyme maturation permease subunit
MLIWSSVWLLFGLVFASLFDSLSSGARDFQIAIESLPAAITSSFNIGSDYLSKVENFISGQFLTLYTLAAAVFGIIIGVGEIGGKIEDGTLLHYLTKNISRVQLYFLQSVSNILFLGFSSIIIWAGLFTEFKLLAVSQPEINIQFFVLGAFSTWLLAISTASFGQTVGVWFSKSVATSVGAGTLVFMWLLNTLSSTEGYPDWLKPFSIFYYIDIPKLRDEFVLDTNRTFMFIVIVIIFTILGSLIFRQKDLKL